MDLLLDTNAFLRWVANDPALSPAAFAHIEDDANQVFVSAVCAWEIAIKLNIGKLRLDDRVDRYITRHLKANDFLWLPIELRDIVGVESLPLLHRDPFDRLLISQARARKLTIVSADTVFSLYDVSLIN